MYSLDTVWHYLLIGMVLAFFAVDQNKREVWDYIFETFMVSVMWPFVIVFVFFPKIFERRNND